MKQFNKYQLYFFIILCGIISRLFGQYPELTNIEINEKANGIILNLQFDQLPSTNDLIAWQANTNWFYLTLYQVTGDSTHLSNTKKPKSVRQFQVITSKESIQLGIRLNQPIEEYDFTPNQKHLTIITNLYFSRDQLASLDTITQMNLNKKTFQLSSSLSNWLYFTGAGLTTSGLIQQNSIQTQTGTAILFITYIMDKIWGIS